jgi:hypothetical protein
MGIALFILGIAFGIALFRFGLMIWFEKIDLDICDYCKWKIKRQEFSRKR